ncbi:GIY-YIg nuclease [Fadolivirus algeromassiliense]|jgi:hypothetical protein|uniref:GIY-YIg nuclease n=1 Tax=Fadolivirus FV1/VV64 TaxID=3070911 RepID=A0A7D3V5D5_9VIRU|nr:GIY-YIg nuclease [Fadolivirus algeromassiliense]QKF93672.1 GIY-YIg nuclease [Fadolivirus FV1/VV64]
MNNKRGYIYIIKEDSTNYYKIGRSYDTKKRLTSIQISNPRKLNVINKFLCNDSITMESLVHIHLTDKNVRGEWFMLNDDELKNCILFIEQTISKIDSKFTCNELQNNNIDENEVHNKIKENDNKNYKLYCSTCEYYTNNKSNYNRHIGSNNHTSNIKNKSHNHMNIETKPLLKINPSCQYCKRTFSKSSNVTRHENICATKSFNEKVTELEMKYLRRQINELKELINLDIEN